MDIQTNWVAVVLAMASSMVVGSVWYAMPVFGKKWAELARVDMKKANSSPAVPIAVTAVVSFITAYVIAQVIYVFYAHYGGDFMQVAVVMSLWLWLGLTAARFITHDAFEGRPWKLTLINAGNELVTIVVMGVVIGAFGA